MHHARPQNGCGQRDDPRNDRPPPDQPVQLPVDHTIPLINLRLQQFHLIPQRLDFLPHLGAQFLISIRKPPRDRLQSQNSIFEHPQRIGASLISISQTDCLAFPVRHAVPQIKKALPEGNAFCGIKPLI